MGTGHVVRVHCSGNPNPKFHFDLFFFTWRMASQGLRKPLKSLHKISKTNFYLTFLKVSPETKKFPILFKSCKRKETWIFYSFFTIFRSKPFSPFLERKKNTKPILFFEFYIWQLFFYVKVRFLEVKKKIIFKVSVIFWKMKILLRVRCLRNAHLGGAWNFFLIGQNRLTNQRSGLILEVKIQIFSAGASRAPEHESQSAFLVFEENPSKIFFFVFRLWISFKNNRRTNVFLFGIFKAH